MKRQPNPMISNALSQWVGEIYANRPRNVIVPIGYKDDILDMGDYMLMKITLYTISKFSLLTGKVSRFVELLKLNFNGTTSMPVKFEIVIEELNVIGFIEGGGNNQ